MAKAASKPKQAAPRRKRAPKPKPVEILRDPMDDPERVYTDDQAKPGTFVEVVKGPHRGRYGVFHSIGEERSGWPVTAVIRTRDAEDENLLVDYGDLRPSEAGRR